MDTERAAELAPEIKHDLQRRVATQYDRIIINVGKVYRCALGDINSLLDTEVYYITGGGIGEKGHQLKQVIRGNRDALSNNPTIGGEQ